MHADSCILLTVGLIWFGLVWNEKSLGQFFSVCIHRIYILGTRIGKHREVLLNWIPPILLCQYIEFEFPFVINSKYEIKKGDIRHPLKKLFLCKFTS
jgi:hypothetical protein